MMIAMPVKAALMMMMMATSRLAPSKIFFCMVIYNVLMSDALIKATSTKAKRLIDCNVTASSDDDDEDDCLRVGSVCEKFCSSLEAAVRHYNKNSSLKFNKKFWHHNQTLPEAKQIQAVAALTCNSFSYNN